MVTMRRGERVRWYTMDMGTEVHLHSPHWHGNTLLVNGMRMDVVQLLPGGMVTGTMVPTIPAPGCSAATSTTTSSPAC
jgi:manganese oxidase